MENEEWLTTQISEASDTHHFEAYFLTAMRFLTKSVAFWDLIIISEKIFKVYPIILSLCDLYVVIAIGL